MIPDDAVEEVRARADLVEVIGEVVPLKRSGKEFKGKCPFHEDRTPSFYVVPDKGFYKCFGCGESGDVFTFLMKRSGMEFLDAVRTLAERYGVEIRETTGREETNPFRAHYEANAFARDWFRSQLLDPEKGAPGRAYLEARGIGPETAERFGLGFAPDGWRTFRDAAAVHEIPEAILLEVGLLVTSERSAEPYDRFRNRVIFPIESISGQVVAFGGRILADEGKGNPKYLNSPESPIYHKGELLYALGRNRNAIRKEGVALVVEGYMDVVSLGAAGVENAVAALGTALTDDHARLLARYTKRVLLLFDSDDAGVRATFRAGDVLLAHGIHPSVVTLPEGEDPDSLVRTRGRQALRPHLDAAVDLVDRKLQLLSENGYFASSDKVRLAVDKLLPTLRATSDPTLRDIYVKTVSERTGVRRETLEDEIAKGARPVPAPSRHAAGSGASGAGTAGALAGRGGAGGGGARFRPQAHGAERKLLMVLLRTREWVERAVERVGPEEFQDPLNRAIFEALADQADPQAPLEGLSPDAQHRAEDLRGDPEELEHTDRVFEDSLSALREGTLQAQHDDLTERLGLAESAEERGDLMKEIDRLRRERKGRPNVVRMRKKREGRGVTTEDPAGASRRGVE